jgi:hypothetical protein
MKSVRHSQYTIVDLRAVSQKIMTTDQRNDLLPRPVIRSPCFVIENKHVPQSLTPS